MIFEVGFEEGINYFNLANLAFELKYYDKAVEYYKKSLMENGLEHLYSDLDDLDQEEEIIEYEDEEVIEYEEEEILEYDEEIIEYEEEEILEFTEEMEELEEEEYSEEYYKKLEYHAEIREMNILDDEIYRRLIDLYKEVGDFDKAIFYCKLMLKYDIWRELNIGRTSIELARLYKLNNDIEKAVETIENLLNYEYDKIIGEPYRDYYKELYMKAHLVIYEILSDVDLDSAVSYLNKASKFYENHKKYILRREYFFAELFKKIGDIYLENKDLKNALKNYIKASDLLRDSIEYVKRYEIIKFAREIYKESDFSDEEINFYLEYGFVDSFYKASSDLNINYDFDDKVNDYLKILNLYRNTNLVDKYTENLILNELNSILSKDDLEYGKCDYRYLAECKIKNSAVPELEAIKAYKEAASKYEYYEIFDKAIACYKKALFYLDEYKNLNKSYDSDIELHYIREKSYSNYATIYEQMASVYGKMKAYDLSIDCILKTINMLKDKYEEEELSYDRYSYYAPLYSSIAYYLRLSGKIEEGIRYRAISLAIYNSDNADKSISQKYEDIELLFELFDKNKILDYILEENFVFKKNKNDIIYELRKLLKDLKDIEADCEIIKNVKNKLKSTENIYFEI